MYTYICIYKGTKMMALIRETSEGLLHALRETDVKTLRAEFDKFSEISKREEVRALDETVDKRRISQQGYFSDTLTKPLYA